jgi:hypothetical protein
MINNKIEKKKRMQPDDFLDDIENDQHQEDEQQVPIPNP